MRPLRRNSARCSLIALPCRPRARGPECGTRTAASALRRATVRVRGFVGAAATTASGEAVKNQRRKRSTRSEAGRGEPFSWLPHDSARRGAISRATAPRSRRTLPTAADTRAFLQAPRGRTRRGHASATMAERANRSVPMLIRIGYDIELAVATPMALHLPAARASVAARRPGRARRTCGERRPRARGIHRLRSATTAAASTCRSAWRPCASPTTR